MKDAALITGAADRIGKEIALHLARLGYHIALHYNRSEEQAKQTQKTIADSGGTCLLFQANLDVPQEAAALLGEISKKLHIRILINNASEFTKTSVFDKNYENMERLFRINFQAPYVLTKEFANIYNEGTVINILDAKITNYATEHFDYLLSKMTLEKFTKLTALQLAPHFRINGIAPGLILPPRDKNPEYLERLARGIPLKKTGSPENITHTVEYLIKNEFVTGQIIYVDGGEHLGNQSE